MQGKPNIVIPQLINAFRQKDFVSIVKAVEATPSLVNVDPVVVQLYGGALRKLAQHKKAAKVFEKGLKKFPSSTDLMNSYGNFLLDNGNPAKASQLFRKASSINTSSLDYKYNLVRSLAAENKYREAKQLGEILLKNSPSHSSLIIQLAAIETELGNTENAEAYLVAVINIDNRNITALNNLGNLLRGQ
ncbi:MAG: tetratricopeptide repeat protein, partial [Pseudomonadota bacterium]|nr:tetratricopeptide repeat protein [Pseudomonadota bacterium]